MLKFVYPPTPNIIVYKLRPSLSCLALATPRPGVGSDQPSDCYLFSRLTRLFSSHYNIHTVIIQTRQRVADGRPAGWPSQISCLINTAPPPHLTTSRFVFISFVCNSLFISFLSPSGWRKKTDRRQRSDVMRHFISYIGRLLMLAAVPGHPLEMDGGTSGKMAHSTGNFFIHSGKNVTHHGKVY